ncbi:MAG: hypothetical protein SFV54_22240 [Bryobacteraceae bacterium]|nr:hypothetical protein [Bryobacteraceae bacterium]
MTRREALRLVTAAAMAVRPGYGASKTHGWGGYVTAACAVDDVRRLLTVDTRAPKVLRTALLKHGDLARLGCGLPKPDTAISLSWPASGKVTTEHRLAVGGGALIAAVVGEAVAMAPDAIALDAALLAARQPSPKALPKAAYVEYLTAMDLRCQIELHTLDPEETDIHAWLEGTAAWYSNTRAYIDSLATALAAGASSPAFHRNDPLLLLAERVRRSEGVSRDALATAKPTSSYGKGLAAALDKLAEVR